MTPHLAKVVISNGFSKFNMDHSAEEAARAGMLARYLTGAYPSRFWRDLLGRRRWRGGVGRFLGRATRLPDSCIDSFGASEIMHLVAMVLPPALKQPGRIGEYFDVRSLQWYGEAAARAIDRLAVPANLYHYRSGFGGRSLAAARRRGMALLCEHSIAHPAAVDYLVENAGRLPDTRNLPPLRRLWRHIEADISQADLVVVNSDFVKQTFVAMGHPAEKVSVLYRGVDDEFFSLLDGSPRPAVTSGPVRLLFAGAFGRRKGGACLAAAMTLLDTVPGWSLTLAGPVEPECRQDYDRLLADPRVHALGALPRRELAQAMQQADIFVFPTQAEGSARVVFEALAAGCHVVTTPQCGSIVGTAAEGILVSPENPRQLADAITGLIPAKSDVATAGARNAALIRSQYRQSNYGDNLIALYDRMAAESSVA